MKKRGWHRTGTRVLNFVPPMERNSTLWRKRGEFACFDFHSMVPPMPLGSTLWATVINAIPTAGASALKGSTHSTHVRPNELRHVDKFPPYTKQATARSRASSRQFDSSTTAVSS